MTWDWRHYISPKRVILRSEWGVQKDAVRFSDLIEGFTEPRGAVLLRGMLYYSERI